MPNFDATKSMLLGDEKDHYRLYHPHMGEVKVAKSALDDNGHKFVGGLPKFSDGWDGDEASVEENLSERGIASEPPSIKKDSFTAAADEKRGQEYRDEFEMDNILSAEKQDIASKAIDERMKVPPRAQQNLGSPDKSIQSQKTQSAGGDGGLPNTTESKSEKPPDVSDAEQPKAVASPVVEQQPAKEQPAPYSDFEKKIGSLINQASTSLGEIKIQREKADREQSAMISDYASGKIDPNRIHGSSNSAGSWMARIGSALAVGLSGFGSGMLGQSGNSALEMIMKQIDNDINAQKADMENKRNLLSMHMAQTNNLREAEARTKSDLYALYNTQIQMTAAKTGNQNAVLQGQLLGQEIINKKQENDRLSDERKATEAINSGKAIGNEISKLSPEKQAGIVNVPIEHVGKDGVVTTVAKPVMTTPQNAEKIRGEMAKTAAARKAIEAIGQIMPGPGASLSNVANRGPFGFGQTDFAEDADNRLEAAAQLIANAFDAGNRKEAVARYKKMLGDPATVDTNDAIHKNQVMMRLLKERDNATLDTYLPGRSAPKSPTKGLK